MASQDFLQDYADEVREHLQELESSLLILEREGTNKEEINQIFRAAHSIKGASAYMGFERLAGLTHELESLMSEIQAQSRPVPRGGISLLLQCVDYISNAVQRLLANEEEPSVPETLLNDLRTVLRDGSGTEPAEDVTEAAELEPVLDLGEEAVLEGLKTLESGPTEPPAEEQEIAAFLDSFDQAVQEAEYSAEEPSGIDRQVVLEENLEAIQEEDQELYNIFLNSFDEQFAGLVKVFTDVGVAPLTAEAYELAQGAVQRLAASSQYMGYSQVMEVLAGLENFLARSLQAGSASGYQYLEHLNTVGQQLRSILPGFLPRGLEPVKAAEEGVEAAVEEEDEELYTIYLDSCRQQFAELVKLAPEAPEALMSEEDYSVVREWMRRMILSSQYMDYEDVADYVKQREESLEDAYRVGGLSGELYGEIIDAFRVGLERMLPRLRLGDAVAAAEPALSDFVQEEDEELFSIFLESCRQHFTELVRLTPSPSDQMLGAEEFDRVLELIDRLVASSRYMDYERVVVSLKEWEEALNETYHKGELNGACYTQLLNTYGQRLQDLMTSVLGPAPEALEAEEPAYADVDQELDASFDSFEQAALGQEESSGEMDLALQPVPGLGDEEVKGQDLPVHPTAEKAVKKSRAAAPGDESVSAITLRVDAQKVDDLLNQVGELVVTRSEFIQTSSLFRDILTDLAAQGKLSKQELRRFRALSFRLNESTLSLGRVANDLQDSVMRIRMLPISQLFQRFPRVIRDQAFNLGKKVELVVEGGDTEIDKRVLEQMHDPIIQFLRNAIVHGIESPSERKTAGKPETGTIRLAAYHEGDYVILEIEDDGRGINTQKLRKILEARRELGAQELERMTEEELFYAIFLPGISTHGRVDGTAGRGVGLDVVKENVERMNGTIDVASYPGMGTRFTVRIPLTVAIIRALLVKGAGQIFTLPLTSVSEILRYRYRDTHTIEGFQVITLRGETIPLVHLTQLLNMQVDRTDDGHKFIVVVGTSFREVGLVVDGLMGEREVVIKSIEQDFHAFDGFSGATILGDGTVSLIVDVSALLRRLKDAPHERQPMREKLLH
jgi:two-component system, chemotaxis family, sensor kinase CheA